MERPSSAPPVPPSGATIIGPLLFVDHIGAAGLALSALFIAPHGLELPDLEHNGHRIPLKALARYAEDTVYRARFACPADGPARYTWGEETFDIACDLGGDLRLAFVSCNGEEHGDLDRDTSERNAMWARLCEDHRKAPFSLLLHGGDQVYADEVTDGHRLSADWPDSVPRDPSQADLKDLQTHLREGFLARYKAVYGAQQIAWMMARVPSLTQWDDHDICDGWGSLKRSRTYSPVGQALFAAARDACLLFQNAAIDGDLPAKFDDPSGLHLGWRVDAPGLCLLGPDLRSERTRRRVMGEGGWAFMDKVAQSDVAGQILLMSSVPLLGPRLSLLELGMNLVPRMQKYEDDLRDQWQSHAHREEWRRMLRLVRDLAQRPGTDLVALSGEIHLATRAEMALPGDRPLHQLVASGIAHRAPPKGWARMLGAISWLGEDPLQDNPIRIRPLPGQSNRYVAQRNYLTLSRQGGAWRAAWHLEDSGVTPDLVLTPAAVTIAA